jgi:hypothetical protein
VTNTTEPRTTGAVNLGPTWNIQGSHRFLNLTSGGIIVRRSWTEILAPSEVILRVEELASSLTDDVRPLLEDEEIQVEEQENNQEASHVLDDKILQAQSIHDQDRDEYLEQILPLLRKFLFQILMFSRWIARDVNFPLPRILYLRWVHLLTSSIVWINFHLRCI